MTGPGGVSTRLRALRQARQLTGRALAEALGWPPPKVSKIEHGRQLPTEDDVRQWAVFCQADGETVESMLSGLGRVVAAGLDFRTTASGGRGLSAVQDWILELYRATTRAISVEITTVPGIAQIEPYARRVLAEMIASHGLDPTVGEIDRAVASRLRRQEVLYDPGKSFELLLTEPVLRWAYCPAPVMAAQMDRLLSLEAMSNVRLGIVPLGESVPVIVQHSYSLFDDLVVVETSATEYHHQGDELAAAYASQIDRLWSAAAEGDEARRIILSAADGYRAAG